MLQHMRPSSHTIGLFLFYLGRRNSTMSPSGAPPYTIPSPSSAGGTYDLLLANEIYQRWWSCLWSHYIVCVSDLADWSKRFSCWPWKGQLWYRERPMWWNCRNLYEFRVVPGGQPARKQGPQAYDLQGITFCQQPHDIRRGHWTLERNTGDWYFDCRAEPRTLPCCAWTADL